MLAIVAVAARVDERLGIAFRAHVARPLATLAYLDVLHEPEHFADVVVGCRNGVRP